MNTLVGDNSETESRWAPAAGLVGTPSTPAGSLKENREISKVGNGRIPMGHGGVGLGVVALPGQE